MSKKTLGWRTLLVVPELETELRALRNCSGTMQVLHSINRKCTCTLYGVASRLVRLDLDTERRALRTCSGTMQVGTLFLNLPLCMSHASRQWLRILWPFSGLGEWVVDAEERHPWLTEAVEAAGAAGGAGRPDRAA